MYYGFTLDALTLKPSDFCNDRDNSAMPCALLRPNFFRFAFELFTCGKILHFQIHAFYRHQLNRAPAH